MTLIEVMVAMGVLLVGFVGTLSGILWAARQNSDAVRMNRASALAQSVRAGLDALGPARVFSATNGIFVGGTPSNCSSDPVALARSGGLSAIANACVVDLDLKECGTSDPSCTTGIATSSTTAVMPGYVNTDGLFHRILVYVPDSSSPHQLYQITVVVSWNQPSSARSVQQTLVQYDPNFSRLGAAEL